MTTNSLFNEVIYLAENSEVAKAVTEGKYASGWVVRQDGILDLLRLRVILSLRFFYFLKKISIIIKS
jgi:hypothetical protein